MVMSKKGVDDKIRNQGIIMISYFYIQLLLIFFPCITKFFKERFDEHVFNIFFTLQRIIILGKKF